MLTRDKKKSLKNVKKMLTCKQHRIVHHEEITRGNGHRETTGKI
jgi:hypothetical protein